MFGHALHYGHHAYGHGSGIGDMIMHAVINGLIYSFIFKLMRSLTLPEAAVLVVLVVGGIWFISSRRRY